MNNKIFHIILFFLSVSCFSQTPEDSKKKYPIRNVNTNNKKIVDDPSIIVLPILKKVEETIVGTIKRIAKGLNIPPVKNKRMLN